MAKQTKLTVNTDAGTFTRTTARTYTHIVVSLGPSPERTGRPLSERHGVVGWTGRLDLAQKLAASWASILVDIRIYDLATGERVGR